MEENFFPIILYTYDSAFGSYGMKALKLVKSTNVSSYPELKRKFWSFNEITYRKNA